MYLENLSLKVDTQKCNLCGACVRECVNNVLTKNEQGAIAVIPGGEERCIHCAHCMMVCPSGALSIDGLDPEKDFEPALRGPEFGKLLNQVKSRRTRKVYDGFLFSNYVRSALICFAERRCSGMISPALVSAILVRSGPTSS